MSNDNQYSIEYNDETKSYDVVNPKGFCIGWQDDSYNPLLEETNKLWHLLQRLVLDRAEYLRSNSDMSIEDIVQHMEESYGVKLVWSEDLYLFLVDRGD